MPWEVRKQNGKFCVVKISDGATVACHDSAASAAAQVRALYSSEDYGLLMAIEAAGITLDFEFGKESDVNRPGGSHNLRNYWTRGAGAAKIGWGTEGDGTRCIKLLGKYVRDPGGLCQEYHQIATGKTMHPHPGKLTESGEIEEFHGTHNQDSHGNWVNGKKMGGLSKSDIEKASPGVVAVGVGSNSARRIRKNSDGTYQVEKKLAGNWKPVGRNISSDDLPKWIGTSTWEPNTPDIHDDFALTAAKKPRDVDEGGQTEQYTDEPWEGVLVVEGVESGDSRMFGLGSLDWAELPMPLQYQPANTGGHNGSITVGEIKHAVRRSNEIYGWGTVFGSALAGEHGDGIRNTMKVGGVSVDVDDVKDAEVEQIFAEVEGGNPFAKPEMTVFHRGRIRGATLVAFPAFVEAKLKFTGVLAAAAEPGENCGCGGNSTVLTASSHTITIPNLPPASWFAEPNDVVSYGALTITDEGRVFGVVAPANTTHRSVKRKVPRNVDFSRFHKGETIVEGGERVVTGVITASCGHAATENYGTLNNRLQHYDNSCSVLANVRVGYKSDGSMWAAGALNPGASAEQVAQALGCALSLDVQPHPDRPGVQEFIAAHLVPVPGFPLARTKASVMYSDGVLVAAAVPINFTDNPVATSASDFDTYHLTQSLKLSLAESIGRDPASRKRELALALAEFHGSHNQDTHGNHVGKPNRAERREMKREKNDRLGLGNPNLREKLEALRKKLGFTGSMVEFISAIDDMDEEESRS